MRWSRRTSNSGVAATEAVPTTALNAIRSARIKTAPAVTIRKLRNPTLSPWEASALAVAPIPDVVPWRVVEMSYAAS